MPCFATDESDRIGPLCEGKFVALWCCVVVHPDPADDVWCEGVLPYPRADLEWKLDEAIKYWS